MIFHKNCYFVTIQTHKGRDDENNSRNAKIQNNDVK